MHKNTKRTLDPLCRVTEDLTLSAKPFQAPQDFQKSTEHDPYRLIDRTWVDERWAPPEPTATATSFRHSHWQAARERARRAMVDAGFGLARRYQFQSCGGNPLVKIDALTQDVIVTSHCCHDRWCRACGRTRRQRLGRALSEQVAKRKTLALVLTLRSRDEPLGASLTRLLKCFAKLRASDWWRERVQGGAWVFEVTHPPETKLWHPHLHIVVHADWLQLQELSREWLQATGDSHRVHVSRVNKSHAAIAELTKYVGKITHRTWDQDQELIAHAMVQLNGRRLCSTFGTWRNVELQPTGDTALVRQWIIWGSVDQLLRLDARKDPDAMAIRKALTTGLPLQLDPQASLPPPSADPSRDAGSDPPGEQVELFSMAEA